MLGIEYDCLGLPVNERVVAAKPAETKKEGLISDRGDVEGNFLVMTMDDELDRLDVVCNCTRDNRSTIDNPNW